MRNYKLIGLTGRSGSGKSIAREFFKNNGYIIIDADTLAREAIEKPIVQSDIAAEFGADLINDNAVDRKELAKRAFKDDLSVKKLNAVMHPHISFLFVDKLNKLVKRGEKNILFDAPQLFEAELDILCDVTVALISDDKTRIERITQRDSISREQAEERLKIQLSDTFFKENCDYCIENNSTEEKLIADLGDIISLF